MQKEKILLSSSAVIGIAFIGIFIFITVIVIVHNVYVGVYYKSNNFLELKDNVRKIVNRYNNINAKIKKIKDCYSNDDVIFNCSLQIVGNASREPYKYLCKYCNLQMNKETLNYYLNMKDDYYMVVNYIADLKDIRQKFIDNNYDEIPKYIVNFDKQNLLFNIGFEAINDKDFPFDKYSFLYVSAGGRNSRRYDIEFDIDVLKEFVEYLSNNVKHLYSKTGQRRLMTSALRNYILKRDNYTCQNCGLSLKDEPHLKLEVDHIIPVSKGGETTEENLQTLCWKCNKLKAAK